jgi:hypothetical protein
MRRYLTWQKNTWPMVQRMKKIKITGLPLVKRKYSMGLALL